MTKPRPARAVLAAAKRAIEQSGLLEHRDVGAEIDLYLASRTGTPTMSIYNSPPRMTPGPTTRSRDWLWNTATRVLTEAGLTVDDETYDTDGRPFVTFR